MTEIKRFIFFALIILFFKASEARRTVHIANTTTKPVNFCINTQRTGGNDPAKIIGTATDTYGNATKDGATIDCSGEWGQVTSIDTSSIVIPANGCQTIDASDNQFTVAFGPHTSAGGQTCLGMNGTLGDDPYCCRIKVPQGSDFNYPCTNDPKITKTILASSGNQNFVLYQFPFDDAYHVLNY